MMTSPSTLETTATSLRHIAGGSLVALGLLLTCGSHATADWPGWRGPNRDGLSTETGWQTDWPASGPKILWQTHVGDGHATMAVADGRVYTVGDREGPTGLLCLDAATGKLLWSSDLVDGNATPTINANRVYISTSRGSVLCFEATDGKLVWQRNLADELEADRPGMYNYNASPLVTETLVIVPLRLDGGMLLGLDRRTGREVWRCVQPGNETYGFWSSPVACTIDGKACVVWLTGLMVVGVAPDGGKTLWQYELAPPEYPLGRSDVRGTIATTPIIVGNRIFAQYHPPHKRGFSFCLEVSGGKPKVLYKLPDLAAWYHSCIFYDGCVYGVDQPTGKPSDGVGILQCYDLQSGRLQWSTDTFAVESDAGEPTRLKVSDTFMIADGKMISWGRELVVAEVNAEGYKVLAAADLGHTAHWTVPVLCDGKIYCRTGRGELLCLDVRKK